MKTILIQFPGHEHGRLFDADGRDGCLEPFIYLRDSLGQLGYRLETADEHPVAGCSRIIFWDVPEPQSMGAALGSWMGRVGRRVLRRRVETPRRDLFQDCIRAGMNDALALFIGEPPVVRPENWDMARHQAFPVVFTWNDRLVDGKKYLKFLWPQTRWFPQVPQVPYGEKKLLVNISGNKFSNHPDELYSARRETIRHFESHQADQFDLYGTGWDHQNNCESPYASYRGTIPNKWEAYPYYRFGLCYENMKNQPGWITEKMFDCMRAGSVPIYWGASNITDFVDSDSFVDRRQFETNAELENFLLNMSERDYERYRHKIREFLASARFEAFLSPAFAETVIDALGL